MVMKLAGLLDKMLAIARRDLLTAIRYRIGFLVGAAGALAELAAFYYLSRAVGPGFRPDGVEYFSFLLVGTGLYTFLVVGINAFLHIVQEAQQTGSLEVLMTTSTPAPVRSEEHTSELQSQSNLVCRLLLEKKKRNDSSALQLKPPP